jgi:GNAT superfamily N-acetyltransferase
VRCRRGRARRADNVEPVSGVRARPIAAADVAAISSLRAAAIAEIGEIRGGPLYPARALPEPGDPDHPLWVGELEGTVVGYLSASASDTLGAIEAVYVDPGCRAVGVGGAMIAEALAWMGRIGCTGVDALALPGARATKNFFEENGFTARLLVVHRRL